MSSGGNNSLKLESGARVGVIGGGPAGSFFSYFLLEMAHTLGLEIALDLYEPRDFSAPGPGGCNMCGGIVSESLVQNLATEGIRLGDDVIQRSIDSYFLHMDVGDVRISTPLQEHRIASVHRGGGPRGAKEVSCGGLDAYLLELAQQQGAQRIRGRGTRLPHSSKTLPRPGLHVPSVAVAQASQRGGVPCSLRSEHAGQRQRTSGGMTNPKRHRRTIDAPVVGNEGESHPQAVAGGHRHDRRHVLPRDGA